ncbi:MAG: Na/Pi symporter [Rubrivivax sp.]|nr:Na/Pi symporter [Rubrivivax sp.]
MSEWPLLLASTAGGVGLFLLGMQLMTDGLKLAAGRQLEQLLAAATRSRARALAAGAAVTALVQSSSAVTVATIGFVNAGLMNLAQSLWVLFGANVGTTMTGWLVALVGLKLKVEVLALPLVGVGMALRLAGGERRRGALGQALAGFGVLFVGIGVLQQAFTGIAATVQLPEGAGPWAVLAQLGIGFLLTTLMQSSSAALTVALSAAAGGLLSAQGAAAVVIGANVGTTVTAVLAAVGATANAKRAAAAHVLFNVITGAVALALLPWLVAAHAALREALGATPDPAAKLAAFHTAFNVLGVLLMWPLAAGLTRWLEARWRGPESDEGRPRHLDRNVLGVPTLALDALERELARLLALSARIVTRVFEGDTVAAIEPQSQAAERLRRAVAEFVVQVGRQGLPESAARRLPELLRSARHAEVAVQAALEAAGATPPPSAGPDAQAWQAFRAAAFAVMRGGEAATRAEPELERCYERLKARLLQAASMARTALDQADAALERASDLHRAVRQLADGWRFLRSAREPGDAGPADPGVNAP